MLIMHQSVFSECLHVCPAFNVCRCFIISIFPLYTKYQIDIVYRMQIKTNMGRILIKDVQTIHGDSESVVDVSEIQRLFRDNTNNV